MPEHKRYRRSIRGLAEFKGFSLHLNPRFRLIKRSNLPYQPFLHFYEKCYEQFYFKRKKITKSTIPTRRNLLKKRLLESLVQISQLQTHLTQAQFSLPRLSSIRRRIIEIRRPARLKEVSFANQRTLEAPSTVAKGKKPTKVVVLQMIWDS